MLTCPSLSPIIDLEPSLLKNVISVRPDGEGCACTEPSQHGHGPIQRLTCPQSGWGNGPGLCGQNRGSGPGGQSLSGSGHPVLPAWLLASRHHHACDGV